MNKDSYLQELRARLSNRMPPQELENVMAYYGEYFDEAGPEREAEVISELGSPERLSHQVIGDHMARDLERPRVSGEPPRRRGPGVVWTVVLALFAAPIAIPLAVALAAVALALVVSALALVAGIGLGGVACIAMGAFMGSSGLGAVFSGGIATTMYFVGGGLLAAGIGVLLLLGAVAISGLCFTGIARLLSRAIHRNRGEAAA